MVRLFRRRFIVDPKFQWTVVIYTFVVSLLTSLAHITVARLEVLARINAPVWIGSLPVDATMVIWLLVAVGYLGILLVAILFSSRLAGPLFRLRRHMSDAAEGKAEPSIHFRRGDYYSELNESYNKLLTKIPRPPGGEKGFSLVEMMVVAGITAILAVIAVASFVSGPTRDARFKEQALNLRETIVNARNLAVSRNQCARVVVVPPREIRVSTHLMNSLCTGALPDPDVQMSQDFSEDITISSFNVGPILMFKPGGGTTVTAPSTISISSTHGESQSFTIYPAIGQVRGL